MKKLEAGTIFRKIIKYILMLFVGSVVGLVALFLVHCIPTEPMRDHVAQAIPILERDFLYQDAIEGYRGSFVGAFTDCLMLEHSIYSADNHSTLEQTLYMYRPEWGEGDDWYPWYSLLDYLQGTEVPKEMEYSRYWHGYLVLLKPLLYFMPFSAVRMLSSAIQLFLVGMILLLCFQKGEKTIGIGFLVTLPFLYFSSLYMSLSLSVCFYLLVIALAVSVKWNDTLCQKQWYGEFFFIIGMATAYFDFLTYPLVTLGFPLCVYLYVNDFSWKNNIKKIVAYSVSWGGGYVGLWAVKWLLTDLLVGGNTIKDAMDRVLKRTGIETENSEVFGFMEVVANNLSAYTNWAFVVIILAIVVSVIVILIAKKKDWQKANLQNAICILVVGLYPIVWFFFTQNHSGVHWMFTCKIFSISVFSFVCAAGKMLRRRTA